MKENFNPKRRAIPKFRELSNEERAELIAKDPAYGRIVCRCETVTEGEIREAIRRPLGAKIWTPSSAAPARAWAAARPDSARPGWSPYCATSMGMNPTEITKFGGKSRLLTGRIGIRKEV